MKKRITVIIGLFIFGNAMAFLEAAVVIYLRELYYPSGFFLRSAADLADIPSGIYRVELLREISTIVMLLTVAFLAVSGWLKRFLAFVFVFSVWDLFYYLFLYLFLGWPENLASRDVYFLLPWPILGPIWFPLLLFALLFILSLSFLLFNKTAVNKKNR